MTALRQQVARLGPIGRVPYAPASLAALLAIPAAWLLHWAGGFPLLLAATAAVFALGLWSAGAVPRPQAVIGAVAGQWIALWPLSGGLWWMGAEPHIFPWPGWVGGFLVFRILDNLKPQPLLSAGQRPGALGVMFGDAAAGLGAALAVMVAAAISHGVLM